MANPRFTKTYDCDVALAPYQIVKPSGSSAFGVAPAAAATDAIWGVTTEIASAVGEPADVVHSGTPFVQLGGTVAAGDWLTSDANGHAVTAAPASGQVANVLGRARYAGVTGDVIEVLISIGQVHG